MTGISLRGEDDHVDTIVISEFLIMGKEQREGQTYSIEILPAKHWGKRIIKGTIDACPVKLR